MAQVDTSIYQNLLRPVKSVQEYDAEAQQAEAAKLQNMLGQAKLGEYQRGVQKQNALSSLLQSGADPTGIRKAGYWEEADKMEGNAAKTAQENAQTAGIKSANAKTDWETAVAKQAHIAQLASSATDQASWTQARKIAEMLGADVSQVPEQFDPATAKHFGSMAMTQAQRLDQAHKEAVLAETARNNKFQNGIAAGQLGVAQGQLGVARQRLATEQSAPKGQYDAERGVLIDPRTGEARPVTMGGQPIGAKDKSGAATEGERNASGYLMRMNEATKLLDKFESKGAATYGSQMAGSVPLVGKALQRVVMDPAQQQYKQAQEDWVRAKLRKESGAAIGVDEMQKEIETYFPMPGEGKEVIAQKRQARSTANAAMQQSAGRASGAAAAKPAGGASGDWGGGWSIQEVK